MTAVPNGFIVLERDRLIEIYSPLGPLDSSPFSKIAEINVLFDVDPFGEPAKHSVELNCYRAFESGLALGGFCQFPSP